MDEEYISKTTIIDAQPFLEIIKKSLFKNGFIGNYNKLLPFLYDCLLTWSQPYPSDDEDIPNWMVDSLIPINDHLMSAIPPYIEENGIRYDWVGVNDFKILNRGRFYYLLIESFFD